MRVTVALGLSLSIACVGCGDTDELDCRTVAYRTCDIRMTDCQRLVFDQMRCLRGDEDVDRRPRVSVISVGELRRELESAVGDSEPDPELEQVYAGLAVLGLLDVDDTSVDSQVDFRLDALLGFYSHDSKAIVVVDHGVPLDDEQATTTLGHEYVHALQDADFDLARYQDEVSFSYDSALASTSVIEGEAMLYDGFQLARIHGGEPGAADWLAYYEQFTDAANRYNAEERSPLLTASAVFPYTYGAHSAATWHTRLGQRGIVRGRTRDRSTQSFLARSAERSVFAPGGADVANLEVRRVPGRESLGADGLGAWMVHSFAVRVLSRPMEPDLAVAWRGDVVSLFSDPSTGDTELVWKIRWSNPARANDWSRQVRTRVARNDGSWDASTVDDTSVVVASTRAGADLDP